MKQRKRRRSPVLVIVLILITFVMGFYSGKTFGLDDIKVIETSSKTPQIDSIQPESNIDEKQPASELTAQCIVSDILLINSENPLLEDYQPVGLISLYEQRDRHFQLAKSDIRILSNVFEAMETMFSAAQIEGVDGFIITSGYRSFNEQSALYLTRTDGTAARPGTSEHETGLAFDVTAMGSENFSLTPQFEWLSQNCGEYGFILRYPANAESITGTPYEPWHYRYVGLPHSKTIMDGGITLEEYLAGW